MKITMKKVLALLLTASMLASFTACGQQTVQNESSDQTSSEASSEASTEISTETAAPTETSAEAEEDVDGELILDYEEELQYANRFTMTRYKGGYTMFATPEIIEGVQYLLVPEGKSVPADLPEGTVVLQMPLTNFRFSSSSMVSLVDAIGGLDYISSVSTDIDGWYLDNVIAKMNAGDIKYSGKYSEPDYEMIVADGVQVNIDTTMLTYKPEVMEKYDELEIPYVVEASSREEHPLGRVEWVKLWGTMMGLEEEAYAYFDEQVANFEAITALDKLDKTVVSFTANKDNLNVHYDNSYYGSTTLFAGCDYLLLDTDPEDTTSYAKMGVEEFYELAKDADYLFSLSYATLFTMQDLIDYNAIFEDFKAVQDGNVYVFKASFVQSAADVVTAISEIRAVLEDPTIEETTTLYKLK